MIPYPQWRKSQPGDPSWDPRLFHVLDEPYFTQPGREGFCPLFTPDYEPDQMIRMGVFGDAYWGGKGGQERWAYLSQVTGWTSTRSGALYVNPRGRQSRDINYHGRPASLSRDWWLDRLLIGDADPLGWFEWYCHYYRGRRLTAYDQWQVQRWCRFKSRHLSMYWNKPQAGQAQALLHWGVRATGGL